MYLKVDACRRQKKGAKGGGPLYRIMSSQISTPGGAVTAASPGFFGRGDLHGALSATYIDAIRAHRLRDGSAEGGADRDRAGHAAGFGRGRGVAPQRGGGDGIVFEFGYLYSF